MYGSSRASWLAGVIVQGTGFGLLSDLIVGLVGGVTGGWLAGALGLQAGSLLGQIIVAALGGIALVLLIRIVRRAWFPRRVRRGTRRTLFSYF